MVTIEKLYNTQYNRLARDASRHCAAGLRKVRDTGRQACYEWEWKNLHGTGTGKLIPAAPLSRGDAKGLARLAGKIAIGQMAERGLLLPGDREAMLTSLRIVLSTERAKHSWGGAGGCYFAGWAWNKPVLLHEVAHWADQWSNLLAARRDGRTWTEHHGHGPKWRGWFLWLLANVEWAGHKYELASLAPMPGRVVMP